MNWCGFRGVGKLSNLVYLFVLFSYLSFVFSCVFSDLYCSKIRRIWCVGEVKHVVLKGMFRHTPALTTHLGGNATQANGPTSPNTNKNSKDVMCTTPDTIASEAVRCT